MSSHLFSLSALDSSPSSLSFLPIFSVLSLHFSSHQPTCRALLSILVIYLKWTLALWTPASQWMSGWGLPFIQFFTQSCAFGNLSNCL